MGRVKEHYHSQVLLFKSRINRALDYAETRLDIKAVVSHLKDDDIGLETLAILADELDLMIKKDPEYFLTCKAPSLRKRARKHVV